MSFRPKIWPRYLQVHLWPRHLHLEDIRDISVDLLLKTGYSKDKGHKLSGYLLNGIDLFHLDKLILLNNDPVHPQVAPVDNR